MEFALILPVMISLFLGVVEISRALAAKADVANMASSAAGLVSEVSSVSAADMRNVFSATGVILYPYDTAPATVTIYSIVDNGASSGKVAWSCTATYDSNGNATAKAGPTTVPKNADGSTSNGGLMIADANPDANGNPQYGGNGSVIIARVDYNYQSPVTKYMLPTTTMTSVVYSKPRRVAQLAQPACS